MRRTAIIGVLVAAATSTLLIPSPAQADEPVPTCDGLPATIVGTDGDDVLKGTPGDDVVWMGPGNDVFDDKYPYQAPYGRVGWLGQGYDVVCGGPGDDTVHRVHNGRYYMGVGNDVVLDLLLRDDRGISSISPPSRGVRAPELVDMGPGDDRAELHNYGLLELGTGDDTAVVVRGTVNAGPGDDSILVRGSSDTPQRSWGYGERNYIHLGEGADHVACDIYRTGYGGDLYDSRYSHGRRSVIYARADGALDVVDPCWPCGWWRGWDKGPFVSCGPEWDKFVVRGDLAG